jgi:hypothetical protein
MITLVHLVLLATLLTLGEFLVKLELHLRGADFIQQIVEKENK